jgi:hypothetical protein|tara:strand:+ start:30 stop:491 length:462 start_codon:yes stop_codon:yes gene_type:complete
MESIINQIRNLAKKEVEDNPQIPEQEQPSAIQQTVETLMQTLKKAIAEGKNDRVVRILSGKEPIPDNSILGEAITKLKSTFSAQLKISEVEAELLAGKIVPGVMGSLVTKTEEGEEQLRDIMQTLGGDMLGDIEGKFGKYLKDDDKDSLKSLF